MEALAEAAGVTKPIVYKHFSNSEDVTVAVLDEYALKSIEYTLDRVKGARDLGVFFDLVIDGLFDYVRENGALSRRITNGFSSTPRIDARFQEMSNRARRIYSYLLEEQGLPASRADLVGYAMMEMINSTILEYAERATPDDRTTLKEMVRGAMKALIGDVAREPKVPDHLLRTDAQG